MMFRYSLPVEAAKPKEPVEPPATCRFCDSPVYNYELQLCKAHDMYRRFDGPPSGLAAGACFSQDEMDEPEMALAVGSVR